MTERLHATEAIVRSIVQWLKLGVEAVGAAVIGVGIFFALRLLLRMVWHREPPSFTAVRLSLARYLAQAAIAPSWEQIGQLGAIAVIRTLLNFFLSREMKEEQNSVAEEAVVAKAEDKTGVK